MQRWRNFKRLRAGRGQSLVEFSLAMVILAFLLMGVIEFGMVFYAYVIVVDATDEAAAYASLYPYERNLDCPGGDCRTDNDDDIIQRVYDTSRGNAIVSPDNFVEITVTPAYTQRDPCTRVVVSTRYHHTFLLPLFFGAGIDLRYEATKMIVPQGAWGYCPPE